MALATSIWRRRSRDDSDLEDFTNHACYAGVTSSSVKPLFESRFFRDDLTAPVCHWWFKQAIPKLCPPEILDQFIFLREKGVRSYKKRPYHITIQADTEKVMWQDACMLFTLCRMIHEQPLVVKKAYNICHTYPKAPFDSLIYYAMTHHTGELQNCNHMLVGESLHVGGWIRDEVKNYSFQTRWRNYADEKRLLNRFIGNRINATFQLDKKACGFINVRVDVAAQRLDGEAFEEYIKGLYA